jgi:hypothetical protein
LKFPRQVTGSLMASLSRILINSNLKNVPLYFVSFCISIFRNTRTTFVLLYLFCLSVKWHHQQRPVVDMCHSLAVAPEMEYSRTKQKSNGNTVSPYFRPFSIGSASDNSVLHYSFHSRIFYLNKTVSFVH